MDIVSYALADEALDKIIDLGKTLNGISANLGADYKQGYMTTTDLLKYLLGAVEGNDDVQTVLANFAFVATEADLPLTDADSEAKFFFVASMKGIYVYDETEKKWIGLFGSALTQLQNDVRAAILKADQALASSTNAITTAETVQGELTKMKSDIGKNKNDIVILKSDISNLNVKATQAQSTANSALSFSQGVKGVADNAEKIALEARELARTANDGLGNFVDEIALAKSMSTAAQATANSSATVAAQAKTNSDNALSRAVGAENKANSFQIAIDDAVYKADEALNQVQKATTDVTQLKLDVASATSKVDAATTKIATAQSTADEALGKATANQNSLTSLQIKVDGVAIVSDGANMKAQEALDAQSGFDARIKQSETNSASALLTAQNSELTAGQAKETADALLVAWENRAQPEEGEPIDYDTLNNKIMSVEAKAIEAKANADSSIVKSTNAENKVNIMETDLVGIKVTVGKLDTNVSELNTDLSALELQVNGIDATLTEHLLNHPTGSGGGMSNEERNEVFTRIGAAEGTITNHGIRINTLETNVTAAKNRADQAVTLIGTVQGTANNALAVAQNIDSKASEALTTANASKVTADGVDAKAQEALDKAKESITTATTANATAIAAKDVADGIDAKVTEAVATATASSITADEAKVTADAAKVTAEGIEAKVDKAVLDAEAALTTSAAAKDIATFVDAKASRALTKSFDAESIALGIEAKADEALTNSVKAVSDSTSAKTTAAGIDAKASKALLDSADALTKATSAKTTAEGIDAKASSALTKSATAETNSVNALNKSTTANSTSDAAKLLASEAKSIAVGIDSKAQTALDNSSSANTTANAALVNATSATQIANKADSNSANAVTIANQAMGRFDQFQLRGWVQTWANLQSLVDPLDGDVYIVREDRRFVYYDANQQPPQFVGLGLGEDLMTKLLAIEKDIKDSASPYDTLKNRLDKLEGYLRFWELSRMEDFRGGTYEDTKYDGGVMLDKGIDVAVIGDITLPTDDFQPKTTVLNYDATAWYGQHHVLKEVYLSTETFKDLDMNLEFKMSGLDQAKVVGARLNANGTNGYLAVFTRQSGINTNTQLPNKNTISIYRITGANFYMLKTVPFFFEENTVYKFRWRLEGTKLTVWQGLANVIDITDASYPNAGHLGGYRLGRRRELMDYTYTYDEDVKVTHSNESAPSIALISK